MIRYCWDWQCGHALSYSNGVGGAEAMIPVQGSDLEPHEPRTRAYQSGLRLWSTVSTGTDDLPPRLSSIRINRHQPTGNMQ